ncbi:type 1 glutamine amidotransferase [Yoonia sp.]|uniref:type 1 glutamine amidotransferase n=1 Tax=Yoonia sp. TaxID=2212373 RepID=UPI001A07ED34|nr:type 1 glutamine amidotransferase [Yoonia sp.]MBE0413255.1 type 1 glutamine amidotransferase [Yoonia sp.]
MKIGILQTGHAPDKLLAGFGDYDDLFKTLLAGQAFEFATYNIVDMQFPDAVTDHNGWLITGSKHGAYEDHAFIPPLEDLIRQIYNAEIPMVGICFGHQIIAQALGGKVEKFAGGWAVGRQTYDWDGQTIALNAWHQDQIAVRPADATVVASNAFCENAALIYGDRAFTVQAHPEFSAEFLAELARQRGPGVVPDAQLDAAHASVGEPTDNAKLAEKIAGFFKERKLL